MDNKQLCDTILGICSLDTNHDKFNEEEHCHSITDQLIYIFQAGYRPASKILEPIEWRYRELNTGADRQCNIVLDTGRTFLDEHERTDDLFSSKCNLFIQTDGGCRHKGVSATGFRVLGSEPGVTESYCLFEGGTLHKQHALF